MSNVYYEHGFSCPLESCRFKSKKFDSIESVNMHITKTHQKNIKMLPIRDSKKRLRLIIRTK